MSKAPALRDLSDVSIYATILQQIGLLGNAIRHAKAEKALIKIRQRQKQKEHKLSFENPNQLKFYNAVHRVSNNRESQSSESSRPTAYSGVTSNISNISFHSNKCNNEKSDTNPIMRTIQGVTKSPFSDPFLFGQVNSLLDALVFSLKSRQFVLFTLFDTYFNTDPKKLTQVGDNISSTRNTISPLFAPDSQFWVALDIERQEERKQRKRHM